MAERNRAPGAPAVGAAAVARRRLVDYPRAGKPRFRRWIPSFKHFLTAFLFVLGLAFLGVGVVYAITPIPSRANADATQQSNIWQWSDGSEIARTGSTNRQNVPLSSVPKPVQQAFLSAENRSFYSDGGISLTGTIRGLVTSVTSGGSSLQGGSTITQQYVKNLYLTQEQTVSRKVKEAIIAVKMDRTESKDNILEGYLNTVYFGRGAYGVQAAAHAYYGVDASQLTVEQGAYLAALINAPGVYDVKDTTDRGRANALARWNYVLDGMVDSKWLPADRRAAMVFPEPLDPEKEPGLAGMNGYLVETAKQYLLDHDVVTEQQLAAGGYTITTTFDKARTQALYDTVRTTLADNLDPAKRPEDVGVRVGGASVDVATGRIVAIYGGPNYLDQFVSDATRRDVQVGSTFKPFVLAAALREGVQDGRKRTPVTPQTRYDGDDDVVITQPNGKPVLNGGKPWRPGNEDGRSFGTISLSRAMDVSANTVYAQLGVDVGPDKVVADAVRAGLSPDTPGLQPDPAVSLGTATPSALDMAGAYATFAGEGDHIDAYSVEKLTRNGDDIGLPGHDTEQAYTAAQANSVNQVLQSVVESGTGTRAKALDRPAAGKTGTTDGDKSAWFVGYTPQLSTAIGMFRQNPATDAFEEMFGTGGLPRMDGGNLPTRMWTAYMKTALAGQPVVGFEVPADTSGSDRQPTPDNTGSAPTTGPDRTPSTTPGTTAPPSSGTPSETGTTTPPTGSPEGTAGDGPTGGETDTPTGGTSGGATTPTTRPPADGGGDGGGGATGGATGTGDTAPR
ncbi:penicillin-binding protein [Yinghuangia sp. ASG 101]|uniref:transglycosylase domain-containing protein n=1 Tax=Yinghuangia sp. ASG 101 TaxID=2896848 RepID=UPI001E305B2B|nr:transglycosylase domain-containing protein [Yinghuangia sp. ASG 101]UGQ14579.1 penicillin-binding protein [Yinghuangia sp. ASG 101]